MEMDNLSGITAAGTGAIGGLTVKGPDGVVVGTAGSISSIDFTGSSGLSVIASTGAAGIATFAILAELVSDTSPQLGWKFRFIKQVNHWNWTS